MFAAPDSIAFSYSFIDVHWYGILMSLAMLVGLIVIYFVRNKYFKEITNDQLCDFAFILIVLGIICARLYYVILDYDYFLKYPGEILAIWNGGISIQGAIIGGICALYLFAKESKLNFYRLADLFSIGLATGQIIGRWGNFFNSEAFGLPTNLPWKLYIPYAYRPEEYRNVEFFHPTFLYESILNAIILAILLLILKKQGNNRKNGIVFASYLIEYSIVRIFVEAIRLDSVFNIGFIHIAQITAFLLIILGILILRKVTKEEIL